MSTYKPEHEQRRTVKVTATVDLPEGIGAEPAPKAHEREKDRKAHRLAVIGVVVNGVLAFFTFVAAATALYVAGLNQRAVDAANQANTLTQNALRLTEAARLSASSIKPDFEHRQVLLDIANTGKLPASRIRIVITSGRRYGQPDGPLDSAHRIYDLGETKIFPGVAGPTIPFLIPDFAPTVDADAVRVGKSNLRIGGRIEYFDGFRDAEPTTMCFDYRAGDPAGRFDWCAVTGFSGGPSPSPRPTGTP